MNRLWILAVLLLPLASMALAHASEQGFVLLLPTDVYISAGVATVILTGLALVVLPAWAGEVVFQHVSLPRARAFGLYHVTSFCATLLLGFLVWRGFSGPGDPLSNPMPLVIWTVWWVGLVTLQGLWGNLWRWVNPWAGLGVALSRLTGMSAPLRYPAWLGHWPGLLIFLAFAAFLLTDPAPADPARLATFVGFYWYLAFLGLVLFGPVWLVRAEPITMLMRIYGRVGMFGRGGMGVWGWQLLMRPAPPLGLAVLILVLLGTGSFDGLNETFWWLGLLGVNPLEFPGRSAVVLQNLAGLLLSNVALITIFALCLWLGEHLSGAKRPLRRAFCLFAPSVLPIALAYHIAHYLTSFMVDGQYVIQMMNDPMNNGAALLGLEDFYVTTGFFNTQSTVKAIWLTQAGVVVAGHVIAILLAHAMAIRSGQSRGRALIGQAPLACFMVAYTFFGLWLLASPRGL